MSHNTTKREAELELHHVMNDSCAGTSGIHNFKFQINQRSAEAIAAHDAAIVCCHAVLH